MVETPQIRPIPSPIFLSGIFRILQHDPRILQLDPFHFLSKRSEMDFFFFPLRRRGGGEAPVGFLTGLSRIPRDSFTKGS